ncbi:hypothetical protein OsJ_23538 [Oryza sativa Japonica Group]|uniref:Uncharacterized protein n=1 Tax=Oryza sativa subsp. japonica TaxID=39947 RepID=B9FW56_ORYSJ|nr:hypothetical protein OsJ_23538 [Oryza sativa Japonica Group]
MATSLSLAPKPAAVAVAAAAIPRLVPPPSIDMSALSPPPPLVSVSRSMVAKHKAVVVMGATGTGKTRLAVDLALQFGGEEFTAADFRRAASRAAAAVAARGALPIIAGGSNSYIEELVDGDRRAFRDRYDCCFLWVDVQLPVLHGFVGRRVDDMCGRGMVAEIEAAFDPDRTDYSRGVWRAIGVPELDAYLRSCAAAGGEEERARLLANAIEDIKANTRWLSCRQRAKIVRLDRLWRIRRVDATEAFRRRGGAANEAWERHVAAPSIDTVRSFLHGEFTTAAETTAAPVPPPPFLPMFALAAAGAGV